jgi:hypothetical protein
VFVNGSFETVPGDYGIDIGQSSANLPIHLGVSIPWHGVDANPEGPENRSSYSATVTTSKQRRQISVRFFHG